MTAMIGPDTVLPGVFFDGLSSEARHVTLRLGGDGTLRITPETGRAVTWRLDRIRLLPDQARHDAVAFGNDTDPTARLLMPNHALLPALPNARKRPPVRNLGQVIKWAAAAVASVFVIIFVLVPVLADQLAEYIPPEGERALGEITLGQIKTVLGDSEFTPVETCEAADGLAALGVMKDRLSAHADLPHEVSVLVLDHDMINAFALPGGYVVFFRGLIDAADSPDEVAAVFAHELGHVASRDPTRNALRSAGSIGVLGLLFGDFAGGTVVLMLAERLIEARYTRAAEAGADDFAHGLLLDSGLPPSALAGIFERLREEYGDADPFVAHFLSHPALGNRIDAARAATPAGFAGQPILSEAEWQALRAVCD